MDLQAEDRMALDALRALIGEVIRLNQEYQLSAKLVHGDDIGAEREAALLEMLVCWFGEFRLLQRATVQDQQGIAYGQYDIVFADRRVPPYRTLRRGNVVISPHGVHAAVEVKSTLTSRELLSSLDGLARLKSAPRCDVNGPEVVSIGNRSFPYMPICGGIFAYRSELQPSSIAARVEDWARSHTHELWPNFVVVLDRGMVMWCKPSDGRPRSWPHVEDVTMWFELGDPSSPLVGLVSVIEGLSRSWHTPGTPWQKRPRRNVPLGIKIGRAVLPPDVPTPPDDCEHTCANCHYCGRMTFAEQRRN